MTKAFLEPIVLKSEHNEAISKIFSKENIEKVKKFDEQMNLKYGKSQKKSEQKLTIDELLSFHK